MGTGDTVLALDGILNPRTVASYSLTLTGEKKLIFRAHVPKLLTKR
jgi:hypothetical protein